MKRDADPLAGPVVAAAVSLPLERKDLATALRGVRDSKEMTPSQRERLSGSIKRIATHWGIGHSSAEAIDRQGIVAATKRAMQRALDSALDGCGVAPNCLFLDYMPWPERSDITQLSIVDGDKHSLSIACASVLAKVWRDQYMRDLDCQYSGTDSRSTKATAHRHTCERCVNLVLAPPIAKPSDQYLSSSWQGEGLRPGVAARCWPPV